MGSRRSSNNKLIFGLLIFILVIAIFFLPSYGWQLREWLSPQPQSNSTQADSSSTLAENQVLEAQITELQVIQSQLPPSASTSSYIRAMVYSRYPLNFKNELLVNAGSNDGVSVGDAVIFQGILVGQVQKVFSDYAIVQTVFDNGIKMAVRIGSTGVDGLLQGSSYPTVGSIMKTAPLTVGDIVYSADSSLPYGLPIGTVAATSTSPDSLFQQATLNFSYDINSIQTVFIEKQ
jgi:cell shape-determining protein MreC